MGGRGSSSGGGVNSFASRIKSFGSNEYGINVTANDGTKTSYIVQEVGDTTYVSRDLADNPEPFPISGTEIANRAAKNGASVSLVTPSEVKKKREAFSIEQRNKPDYELGIGVPWGGRQASRNARQNRLSTRAMKRKGR